VVLTCPADKVLKINSILLYGSDAETFHVDFYDSSVTTAYSLYSGQHHIDGASNFPIPHPYPVIDKDRYIYLEEGDQIRMWRSTGTGTHDAVISYEEIDDA